LFIKLFCHDIIKRFQKLLPYVFLAQNKRDYDKKFSEKNEIKPIRLLKSESRYFMALEEMLLET